MSDTTKLTPRESEIMNYVAAGKKNREIAEHLGIREHTIESHLRSVFGKFGVDNRTQAAICFLKLWQSPQSDLDEINT